MDNVIHRATIKHLHKEIYPEIIQVNQNEIVKKNYENPQENRKNKNIEMKNKRNEPKK